MPPEGLRFSHLKSRAQTSPLIGLLWKLRVYGCIWHFSFGTESIWMHLGDGDLGVTGALCCCQSLNGRADWWYIMYFDLSHLEETFLFHFYKINLYVQIIEFLGKPGWMIRADTMSQWMPHLISVSNKTVYVAFIEVSCVCHRCVCVCEVFSGLKDKLLMRYFIIDRSAEAEVGCGPKKHCVE